MVSDCCSIEPCRREKEAIYSTIIQRFSSQFHLQLGLGLGLLQDGVQLGGLHDISLNLKLAAHEQALGVGLAGDELTKVVIRELQGHCCRKNVSMNVRAENIL